MSQVPTAHNAAGKNDFAPAVLMPGDPLRAQFIARTFLENARLVNDVRGIQGYTGTYRGKPVSVMASGMGMPTMGIYSYELFNFYGVERIIRVGSAGMISQNLRLRDVVAGMSAYSNSAYGAQFGFSGNLAPCADFSLLLDAYHAAGKLGVALKVGPIFSSDVFYDESVPTAGEKLEKLGVLAVEMEAYALYLNAARAGKKALALLTISDNPVTGEALSSQDRQSTFTQMMEIALEIA
jgi:purine-nucleoside phosphorylase